MWCSSSATLFSLRHHHYYDDDVIKHHLPTTKQQLSLPFNPTPFSYSYGYMSLKTKTKSIIRRRRRRAFDSDSEIDCVGTGTDVECVVNVSSPSPSEGKEEEEQQSAAETTTSLWEWMLLVSPFFFWGTAMVAMKEVLPKTGPIFISSFRLIPSGFLLVAFAASRGRKFPSGLNAWFSIALFALVDASCFQVPILPSFLPSIPYP